MNTVLTAPLYEVGERTQCRQQSVMYRADGRDYGEEMTSRLVAVTFESRTPAVAGAFWAAALGREIVQETHAVLVPGTPTQVGLRFIEQRTTKAGPNRLHLHLTNDTIEGQKQAVQRLLDLGASRRGAGALPFGRDIYMADPGGDEFCEIEPGNTYLQGCGLLGEVTCQGTPAAGRFWLAALDWSLVWDQDEQIAIQSPVGGTKIAWDGRPEPDAPGWNRQRFDLDTTDADREIQRLIDLGANIVSHRADCTTLADPDGSEFTLTRSCESAPG